MSQLCAPNFLTYFWRCACEAACTECERSILKTFQPTFYRCLQQCACAYTIRPLKVNLIMEFSKLCRSRNSSLNIWATLRFMFVLFVCIALFYMSGIGCLTVNLGFTVQQAMTSLEQTILKVNRFIPVILLVFWIIFFNFRFHCFSSNIFKLAVCLPDERSF